jgi:hypothetical protein
MYFLISTYSNFLTISLKENGKLTEKSIQLDATVLNDSEIRNITEFTKILFNNLYEIKGGNYKNIPVVFMMDPLKNHFRYIKSQKELNFDNQTSAIFTELKIDSDDYYFGIHKISPFVSQFIATKKSDIDTYINVANELECELLGIFSYLPLIAKHVSHNGNLIILTSYLGNICVALSEMNGIYFNNKYGSFKDAASIQGLIENLRVFKSSTQNNKLVSFNFENPEATQKLGIPEIQLEDEVGFKNPIHKLADKVLTEDYINSSYNLVNSYFEKATEKKKPSMVVVGSFVFLLLAGVCSFCYTKFVDDSIYNKLYENVLGESTVSNEVKSTQPAPVLNTLEVAPVKNDSLSTSNLNTSPAKTISSAPSSFTNPSSVVATEPLKVVEDPLKAPHSDSANFKRDTLKVSIINTTGVTGLAKRNADVLTVLGYKNVQLGTSNDAVTGTVVKIKSSMTQYKDQIYKDLLTFKSLTIQETLPETSPLDIVIVLGK